MPITIQWLGIEAHLGKQVGYLIAGEICSNNSRHLRPLYDLRSVRQRRVELSLSIGAHDLCRLDDKRFCTVLAEHCYQRVEDNLKETFACDHISTSIVIHVHGETYFSLGQVRSSTLDEHILGPERDLAMVAINNGWHGKDDVIGIINDWVNRTVANDS